MWVMGGSWPRARLEGHRGSDAGRPGRAQDGPGRSTESRGRQDTPLEHTLGRGGQGSPQRGRGDPARLRKQKEGSFQPGEELRCKCRKGGITLESSPPKRWCLLTPKACEWTLCGSRVFAGDQVKMSSVAWAPRPFKSGDLDTERTQRDDNLKTGEERTPDRSRSPEPLEAAKRPAQTQPQKHQPADTWPGPLVSRLGQQSLLSRDPRMLTAGFRVCC